MSLIRPKIIGAVALVIILTLLVSLAQEMNRRIQVQREVVQLQQEVDTMEKNIVELENLNTYFNTDAYQERLAREKLNYQLPGEKVVLIPQENDVTAPGKAAAAPERQISMPERWWRTFFVPEPITTE